MASIVLLLVVTAVCVIGVTATSAADRNDELLFQEFMHKHQRIYDTPALHTHHFRNFKANMELINSRNQTSNGLATYGITKFTDLSPSGTITHVFR